MSVVAILVIMKLHLLAPALLLFAVPFVSSVSATANTPESQSIVIAEVPQGYQTVDADAWSFAVPPGFQATEPSESSTGNVSVVAQYSGVGGLVLVNLVTEPIDPADQEAYLENSVEFLNNAGITVLSQEPLQIGAMEGAEVESRMDSMPPVRLLQRIVASPSTGYALTCGALDENFEQARDTCATILSTLEIQE